MNIALLEPLRISRELLEELSAPLRAGGHAFTAYDQKSASEEELISRVRGQDILMIANAPFSEAAVRAANQLRFLDEWITRERLIKD